MSQIVTSDGASPEADKPVHSDDVVEFPPLPEPTDDDFDDDVSEEEKTYFKNKFPDLNLVVHMKLHCTACDRHLGCSARNESRMRSHPMLKTLICHTCHSFYNSGEFDKGEDGSELYCRWCGQGGQVYCCSDCVHVFCAKCIKRNFGIAKIREIENTDDWKCFKCNPKCLKEQRSICWALLRFCDLRNKIVFKTEDPELKEKYQKLIAIDNSECCKNRGRRERKSDSNKKKEKEKEKEKEPEKDIQISLPKFPPTIQVKKFASINLDETPKKNMKRPASPKIKPVPAGYIQKPIAIAPCNIAPGPLLKKIRLPSSPLLNPVRFANEKRITNTYTRIPNSRTRPILPHPIVNSNFNGISPYGFNMPLMGDNLNLSLESLTQGLDMAAMAAYNNSQPTQADNDNVVCTPDFPLEPLCEVTEDNDDDVECITPSAPAPKLSNPPPLVPRSNMPELSSDNIVQMTDNDVTVNALTGGLKFRVDPQTLSSKKMYRLPDGRIFAINPNPNMPGGYSATIVSLSDGSNKVTPRSGETYAAKLSAISATSSATSKMSRANALKNKLKPKLTLPTNKVQKKTPVKEIRQCDLKVPVEWYRYNLIDAVDALDYSLSRLNKLKKEATTAHLRTRTVDEVKYLHRTLDQLLATSSKRFLEIRESLNKEMKQFVARKASSGDNAIPTDDDDDDDDVEFLPNPAAEDPIFIDENSCDSIPAGQEVDLTVASSEHNDSAETDNKNDSDPLSIKETGGARNRDVNNANENVDSNDSTKDMQRSSIMNVLLGSNVNDTEYNKDTDNADAEITPGDKDKEDAVDTHDIVSNDVPRPHRTDDKRRRSNDEREHSNDEPEKSSDVLEQSNHVTEQHNDQDNDEDHEPTDENVDKNLEVCGKKSGEENNSMSSDTTSDSKIGEVNGEKVKSNHNDDENMDVDGSERSLLKDKADSINEKIQDTEMSEEFIDSLLKDDSVTNTNSTDIPEEV